MVRNTLCFSRPFHRLRKFMKKAVHPGRNLHGEKKDQKCFPVGQEEYEVMEEIGRGGSAIVYKAKCLALNEVVAIKCLDLDGTGADMEKIRREAKTLLLLSHPNVLSAHCVFIVNHYLWEVMPFIAGGSFHTILRTFSPDGLQESVVATVLKETLKALDYLHKEGHIHRDVKAGNILVDSDGSVKLADFGVSASIFESGDREKMKRNTITGTLCWMAPEVIFSEANSGYDQKADIWSLGITAMELAQGHPPYFGKQPMHIIGNLVKGNVPKFTDSRFSTSFREMVASCLVVEPLKRPSAEKLLKHSFFKQHARSPDYLVKNLINGLLPLSDRVKIAREEEHRLMHERFATLRTTGAQTDYGQTVSPWDFKENEGETQQNMGVRERNDMADKLSKDGIQQVLGSWRIVEEINGQDQISDQPPYAQNS